MSTDDEVELHLTRDEALVLFEFLSRFSDDEPGVLAIRDQAEERVLWDMQVQLAATLHEPINNLRYDERIAQARAAVRDEV